METTFQIRLSDLRAKKGVTQQTVAKAIGVTPQAYSYYMNGREPSYEILVKIAQYFNVSVDFLLGRHESKSADNEEIRRRTGLTEEAIESLENRGVTREFIDDTTGGRSICFERPEEISEIIAHENFADIWGELLRLKHAGDPDWPGWVKERYLEAIKVYGSVEEFRGYLIWSACNKLRDMFEALAPPPKEENEEVKAALKVAQEEREQGIRDSFF